MNLTNQTKHTMSDIPAPGTYLLRLWDRHAKGPIVAVLRDGSLYDITTREAPLVSDICAMEDPLAYVRSVAGRVIDGLEHILAGTHDRYSLIAPCDLQAVKAAGVTFVASMIERVIEERAAGDANLAEDIRAKITTAIGAQLADIVPGTDLAEKAKAALIKQDLWSQYLEVGIGPDAEVFSKCQPMASVGHRAQVGLHPKSDWNNPEPELVLVVSPKGQILGATLGNDVNLRDFEGRSALLLSKAKDNNASCSLGPMIRLFDAGFSLEDLMAETLTLEISGSDGFALEEACHMSEISRDPRDLVAQTFGLHHQYPDGFMLFLGTPFAPTKDRDAPGMGFTHHRGDRVTISTPELGTLVNTVACADECPPWTFGTRELMRNLAARGLL